MTIFLDTNIVIELIEGRAFSNVIYEILDRYSKNKNIFFLSTGGFYTITYLVDRHLKQEGLKNPERLNELKEILRYILSICDIAPLDKNGFKSILESDCFIDLEDGYQYQAALNCKADVLITLNKKDYMGVIDNMMIMTPTKFINKYHSPK